jgi:hypothetical protein
MTQQSSAMSITQLCNIEEPEDDHLILDSQDDEGKKKIHNF